MKGIVKIGDAGHAHGGKAQGLRRLIRLGLPVPKAIAVDGPSVSRLLRGDATTIRKLSVALRSLSGNVAVRSSALREDGNEKSFAGAFDTVLNVDHAVKTVVDAIRLVGKSGASDRVSHYAGPSRALIPVIIQQMVRASRSGVLFSRASGPDGRPCAYAEWVRGLGDSLVSGKGRPATLTIPWNESISALNLKRVIATRALPPNSLLQSLTSLAEVVDRDHSASSWDVEWAQDRKGQVWALQMRPVTANIIADGGESTSALGASKGIAVGKVRFVDDETHHLLKRGEVLVARITEINYVPAMQRASAIVTEEGGLLSHAAIVARELGKPCVVGATGALTSLQEGLPAEVNGTLGVVRQGDVKLGNERQRREVDWTAVYLYDRGIEFRLDDIPLFLETTPSGAIAYVDSELDQKTREKLRGKIQLLTSQDARIVVGDKRIWFREWRRFDTFLSISLIDSMFRVAIAAWDRRKFATALAALKRTAAEVSRQKQSARSSVQSLFWSEMGAALHALVAVEVEGRAVWAAYRDTQDWRIRNAVPFSDVVAAQPKVVKRIITSEIRRIMDVLKACGEARNSAYEYFARVGAFDASYFGRRHKTVEAASLELDISYHGEGDALDLIYQEARFQLLDRSFSTRVPTPTERNQDP